VLGMAIYLQKLVRCNQIDQGLSHHIMAKPAAGAL
jgi:hypothetical protein